MVGRMGLGLVQGAGFQGSWGWIRVVCGIVSSLFRVDLEVGVVWDGFRMVYGLLWGRFGVG